MGLLSAGAYAPGQGMPMRPQFMQPQPMQQPQMQAPQMPQGGGGFMGAFSGNPQFQQLLQQIQAGRGPGSQPVQFTPPQTQMNLGAPASADLWHDGIAGNARAAGLKKPGHGNNGLMGALFGQAFGGI